MKPKAIFAVLCALAIPVSIGVIFEGIRQTNDSKYVLEDINHGFVFSIIWAAFGVMIFWQWTLWFLSHVVTGTTAYDTEQLMFNAGIILLSTCFIITGILSIENNPLYLNVCQCPAGYYGIDCTECPGLSAICSGHGECDDLVDGRGTCGCDTGYTGTDCDTCAPHFTKNDAGDCVCERVWSGDTCNDAASGFDTSQYPYVFCKRGWTQTAAIQNIQNPYWTTPTFWPVCGKCAPGFSGHPTVDCIPCLDSFDGQVCNGRGTCWDNKRFEETVWDCQGPNCAVGVVNGGIKNTCTQTSTICVADLDCPGSFNCGGRCRSKSRWPNGPSATWTKVFDGKVCHDSNECNFDPISNIFTSMPVNWDNEGECVEKTCCAEPKIGNSTCHNCKNDDGSASVGRLPPACGDCPGWDNDIDTNGQTICNGKGTCLPMYDTAGEYRNMECKCQTQGDNIWRGDFCECLADAPYSTTCQRCAQGFYVPPDHNKSVAAGVATAAESICLPCPGAESGTGMAACSWKRGLGTCVYNDAVGEKHNENAVEFEFRLGNVGKCSCTNQLLDVPVLAAKGAMCDEAPANFYKVQMGQDWFMTACPRTLPLDVAHCIEHAPEYLWDYIRYNGQPDQSCTQSCGGKPLDVSMCMDEMSQNSGYLQAQFSEHWDFMNLSETIPEKTQHKGVCFCNGTDMLPGPEESHYYRAANGLCTKSKVKY